MRTQMNPTERSEHEMQNERSNPTEQTHDSRYDDHGYDDGLVHSHGWAVSSQDR